MPFWTNKAVLAGLPRYLFCWGFAGFFAYLALDGITWSNLSETSAPIIRAYGVLHAIGFVLLPRWVQGEKFLPVPERVTMDGGMGIMADDWAAGVWSCLALHLLRWLGLFSMFG